MRSEGNRLVEAVDELIRISRDAGVPAEIYHLKAAGQSNWPKMDAVIALVEAARKRGPADHRGHVHLHRPAAPGLDASMPPWAEDGGYEALFKRLQDPVQRAEDRRGDAHAHRRVGEPRASRPDRPSKRAARRVQERPRSSRSPARRSARWRGCAASRPRTRSWISCSRTDRASATIYFLMSEDNIRKQLALPWVSLGSDAGSMRGRRRVPEVVDASPRLRQLRAIARQVRARRKGRAAAGRRSGA